MKQFLSVKDAGDLDAIVAAALHYKQHPYAGEALGDRKKIGLLFLNPSLRTRISTQVAARNLGLEVIVFNVDKDGWALEFGQGAVMNGTTVEHIKDAAPVLGTYFDILCIRTFPSLKNKEEDYAETVINQFLKYAGIPVISLESATLHPLQSLADLVTIKESLQDMPRKPRIVLTWAPHIKPLPQCVANSFAQWMTTWDKSEFIITHPEGYTLDTQFTRGAVITNHQQEALEGADFVYVKNWSSFEDYGAMPGQHADWMLTNESLAHAPVAKIMHCLPVRRNVELSDELLDGSQSLVTRQAANRVWSAQAVIAEILKTN